MSLKIGRLPDRTPMKLSLALPPEVHDALLDYAAIHAQEFGKKASGADLAALMIERFLDSDASFRRARKSLRQTQSEKE